MDSKKVADRINSLREPASKLAFIDYVIQARQDRKIDLEIHKLKDRKLLDCSDDLPCLADHRPLLPPADADRRDTKYISDIDSKRHGMFKGLVALGKSKKDSENKFESPATGSHQNKKPVDAWQDKLLRGMAFELSSSAKKQDLIFKEKQANTDKNPFFLMPVRKVPTKKRANGGKLTFLQTSDPNLNGLDMSKNISPKSSMRSSRKHKTQDVKTQTANDREDHSTVMIIHRRDTECLQFKKEQCHLIKIEDEKKAKDLLSSKIKKFRSNRLMSKLSSYLRQFSASVQYEAKMEVTDNIARVLLREDEVPTDRKFYMLMTSKCQSNVLNGMIGRFKGDINAARVDAFNYQNHKECCHREKNQCKKCVNPDYLLQQDIQNSPSAFSPRLLEVRTPVSNQFRKIRVQDTTSKKYNSGAYRSTTKPKNSDFSVSKASPNSKKHASYRVNQSSRSRAVKQLEDLK